MSNGLVKSSISDLVLSKQSYLSTLVPVGTSSEQTRRAMQIAINCIEQNDMLKKCEPTTLVRAIAGAMELGLEPGGILGEAYLVPYGQKCTLIIGYKGLLRLCYESGNIRSVKAKAVYTGDEFDYAFGLQDTLTHKPCGNVNPNELTHVYAVVTLSNGEQVFEVMTREQVDKIRNGSPAGKSGPWVNHYAEMAIKTVIRKALKVVPKTEALSRAVAIDDANETGNTKFIDDHLTPDFEIEPVSRVQQMSEAHDAIGYQYNSDLTPKENVFHWLVDAGTNQNLASSAVKNAWNKMTNGKDFPAPPTDQDWKAIYDYLAFGVTL